MRRDRSAPVIVWFRNDRRVADQAALHAATATGRPVLPVFLLDTATAGRWATGGAARWWLHHSLVSLHQSLADRGAGLLLRRGQASAAIPALAREIGAAALYVGASPDPWARTSDDLITQALAADGMQVHRLRTSTLFDPDAIRSKAGGSFSVYRPFAKACLSRDPQPGPLLPAPVRIHGAKIPSGDTLDDWSLLPTTPDWAGGLRAAWQPGEPEAIRRLHHFIDNALDRYAAGRDRPDEPGTSMLSPYLAHGEISPTQVWHAIRSHPPGNGGETFLKELLWREFSATLLWHHPSMPDAPLRAPFDAMPWRNDPGALMAWQRGQTGIPIVDAGMRQLWTTGWMHNRVRMIVASFLVKHLMMSWQDGEAWFWDTLVDADLANNAASWQWIAGSGVDAAPYFRVFNPVLQGRKFDSDGAYVRHFVPELAGLSDQHIHAPWDAPAPALKKAGVTLGATYPAPMVDLAGGRARALAAFAALRHRG